jgi:hypothetical protein
MSEVNAQLQAILSLMRAGQWNAVHDAVQRHEGLLAAWLHGLLHRRKAIWRTPRTGMSGQGCFRQRGTLQQELARFDAALRARSGA